MDIKPLEEDGRAGSTRSEKVSSINTWFAKVFIAVKIVNSRLVLP